MKDKIVEMLNRGLTAQQIADDFDCDVCIIMSLISKINCGQGEIL